MSFFVGNGVIIVFFIISYMTYYQLRYLQSHSASYTTYKITLLHYHCLSLPMVSFLLCSIVIRICIVESKIVIVISYMYIKNVNLSAKSYLDIMNFFWQSHSSFRGIWKIAASFLYGNDNSMFDSSP